MDAETPRSLIAHPHLNARWPLRSMSAQATSQRSASDGLSISVTNVNDETLLLIFVACTGAAVLMQALVLLAMLITARKALKLAEEQIAELRTTVLPVVKDTKELLSNLGPKIEVIATDFAALTHGLRKHGIKLEESATDILERVNRQSTRMDMMLTNVLDTVDRAGAVVADVISVPLRQLAGVAAFARAAFGTLRNAPPRTQSEPQPTHSPADKDLFV
jgi:hypothetical protein